jgi:hypothetical protein
VAIAREHNGAERARPYGQDAGATFPTPVDEQGATSRAFGVKAIPNGVLVDADGIVRYAKYGGGFSVDNRDDVAAVEWFAGGGDPGPGPEPRVPYQLGPVEQEEVATKLRRGHHLATSGRSDEALAAWREGLRLDPENLVIRKQIWAASHPEKFHPTIDWAWQKEQLAREREAEIAADICGPDGCPIRRTNGG